MDWMMMKPPLFTLNALNDRLHEEDSQFIDGQRMKSIAQWMIPKSQFPVQDLESAEELKGIKWGLWLKGYNV